MRAFVRIARPSLAASAAAVVTAAVAVALVAPNSVAAQQPPSADAAPTNFHAWHDAQDFQRGSAQGVAVTHDGLRLTKPIGSTQYPDPSGKNRSYDYARWTSPTYRQGFGATQLVSSWNADTPAGTWLQVAMRGHTNTGEQTGWYIMGRWASGDSDIKRTSVDGQSDANGDVSVDTFESAKNVTLTDYQLQVTLYRASGSRYTPTVSMVGAMTSNIPDRFTVPTSPAAGAWGIELPVPRYSQDIHKGQYPQYDGGGEAWCSPTSTEMITEYWHKKPTAQQLSWV
ncbi:MAG: C39 family peptidase, partial [Sciscionella sp.]|nr:C39 family peptidase [Sciscionella sp.]